MQRAAVVCGGRARGRAPLGGAARVPWGPTHGRGRVRSGVVGPGSGRHRRQLPVGCDGPGRSYLQVT